MDRLSQSTKYKKFPLYKQKYTMDCGPSCLHMISKYYGKTISDQRLSDLCSLNSEGTSVSRLCQVADSIGLNVLAVLVPYEALREIPLPAIALWNKHHYIVIYKLNNSSIFIADPMLGFRKYIKEEFIRGWLNWDKSGKVQGMLLLLEPTPNFNDV